jgi:phospho-N-acetylmuramoyl-pentapeptide-transferase
VLRIIAVSVLLAVVTPICSSLFALAMRRRSYGQRIRDCGPKLHAVKSGTATMGGVVILVLWSIGVAVLHNDVSANGLFVLYSGLFFGVIGFLDDLLSQIHKRSLGLTAYQKIILSIFAVLVLFLCFPEPSKVFIQIPFIHGSFVLPPLLFFFLLCGVLLSTTNSMNLTDGLDGLAVGTSIIILVAYVLLFRNSDLLATILPLVGILIGFLWVNTHPACLFLGDVGSFALGGAIGGLAIVTGTSLCLPLLAGLLFLESVSVIMQVAFFKLTGKRIFKISPLHHHFEVSQGIDHSFLLPSIEWPEQKVTARLWIVQAILAGIGILCVYGFG